MKNLLTRIVFTFLFFTINKFYAQNTCDGAISLPNVSNYCSPQKNYTNVGVTPSTFAVPACWTDKTAKQDIWFKFRAIGTDVTIKISGGTGVDGTIKKPNVLLMTDCTGNNYNEIACVNGTRDTTDFYFGGLVSGVEAV